jgi:hypothetical protein
MAAAQGKVIITAPDETRGMLKPKGGRNVAF